MPAIEETAATLKSRSAGQGRGRVLDAFETRYAETWQAAAGLKTYGQAVADVIEFRAGEGERFDMTVEEWLAFANRASLYEAREKAKSAGHRHRVGLRVAEDARGLLPGAGRHRLRHRQVAGRRAVRRSDLDGDEDRRSRTTPANSRRPSTRSSRTRCWPTTSRPRSTGTRPA